MLCFFAKLSVLFIIIIVLSVIMLSVVAPRTGLLKFVSLSQNCYAAILQSLKLGTNKLAYRPSDDEEKLFLNIETRSFADLLVKGDGLIGARDKSGKPKHASVMVSSISFHFIFISPLSYPILFWH